MALVAGTSVGRYEIQSPLGKGGMGEVYLARDPLLSRTVAVKLLPTVFADDPDRLRRFEQEAQATAALNHPRILAVHDVGRIGDQPFIVMEYVRGETLAAYLKRGRPPVDRALEIGIEIADALDAAHRARVVHRDLKPANVMLTGDGHVKVLDFGLAKFLQHDTSAPTTHSARLHTETMTGQLLGTPVYMSPEQLLGDRVDQRTDIYTLGVILFEMLAGQRPHDGDIMELLRNAAQTTPVPTVRDVDPTVAPEVSQVIARCMARNSANRFQTAGELEAELQRLLGEGAGLSDGRQRSLKEAADAGGRRRITYRYAAWLLAGALVIGGIASIPLLTGPGVTDTDGTRRSATAPAARPVIAVLPFENATGDASKAYIGIGMTHALTNALTRLSSITVVQKSDVVEAGATRGHQQIARELGATMLVEGSFQQAGDLLGVSVSLVTPDGGVLISRRAEARESELFRIQNQLAEALLSELRIQVNAEAQKKLERALTEDDEALKEYWRGLELMDRPDPNFTAAVALFTLATERDRSFAEAFAALGEVYRRQSVRTNNPKLMDEALRNISEALRLDSDQPEIRMSLAAIYRSTGRPQLAIDEVVKVIAAQPANDNAHRMLGELRAKAGQPTEALEAILKAVKMRPDYWRNQEALGLFYYGNGQVKDAINAFTRLSELKPDDFMPFQQLGAMYLVDGDLVRAKENSERSNRLKPNAESFTNLGTIAYYAKNYDEAITQYRQAVKLESAVAVYHGNLGDALRKRGRGRDARDARAAYRKAIDAGELALKVNHSDVTTVSQLGVYYAKVGSAREAEQKANQARQMNPTDPNVLYLRAVVLALIGKRDDAMRQLSDAIDRGYPRQMAPADDDLVSLRKHPDFKKLEAAAKSR